ncbi:MAG: PAS domain-containing protein, partial [Desulfovibrio sp.]|uniref:PAS domain-containing protein n=1 Tax=Desulfovibrio sp. TaxID=885 RepID=UPI002585AE8C
MSPFTKNSEVTSLILDSLPMGVLFCDMDGVIRFVNKAYADLLGQRPEELLGRDITEIIPHSRARVVLRDGRAEMGELCQLGPGNALPVIVNRIPVRGGEGRLAGWVCRA